MSDSKRLLSVQILQQILEQKGSLTYLIPRLTAEESPESRAFIQALCFGVCRHFHRLDFICRKMLNKPLRGKDSDIHALILTGLYQLFCMRVPAHAAVNETVAAAGLLKKPWAKNLVNAVLREAQRREADLAAQIDSDFSLKFSHPQWLIDALKRDWPRHYQGLLAANNEQAPMTLRLDLKQASREDYLARLAAAGIKAAPGSLSPGAVILDQPTAVMNLPGFAEGLVSVQDEAAQLAAELLELAPGQQVLDACAAPGGKTCAMLQGTPDLVMTALDNDAGRLERVRENLDRSACEARLICADVREVSAWWGGEAFDRILLDVPCSGTGVIRRHPDIKLLRSPAHIAELQGRQLQILDAAWPLLKPGGLLLYSTCSVLLSENSEQIAAFLTSNNNAREQVLEVNWGLDCTHGRQLLPGKENHDGFYYALLRKC